jgi:uncharacterized protein YprB with RNaseH-like and TPR domain
VLESSFVHLPGIGPDTEQRFWSQGVHTWDQLAENLENLFGPQKARKIATALEESRRAHEQREFAYFQARFKGADMWRLYPVYLHCGLADDIAYLDIETTGLGFPPQCKSTSIAVLFRGQLHLEHEPTRKRRLMQDVERDAKLLVTFNGGTFDLPFLRREFNLELRHPHLDLRYWFARLGYRGGLKAIQKCFAQIPQRESMDIDGFDAVRLWKLHERGVPRALDTLFTYNAEDTLVLEQLVFCGLNLEALQRPMLKLATYDLPQARTVPTRICPQVYRMLRG